MHVTCRGSLQNSLSAFDLNHPHYAVAQAVWVDPVCGDGVCESPWEFASYSSFGCRADCGKLQDVQNLTSIQVDLAWNFGHPLGSTPAAVSG